ncbi:DUF4058 family protein [Roseiflexus sp.]|uniref:DUF4058 family protein n=1 Tax=Roseiflexus sp. TaxID=2562120 RepID=UPI0021DE7B74|nr:DUF4058 family protein [Roseiflexus sp.]GIV98868.1 MAG: hypothetical protein KatS3mg058_0272 [Roseiflexus sp.]
MPSPFPGMDSYLEGELVQAFHERLAHQISVALMPPIRPRSVALLAKRWNACLALVGYDLLDDTQPLLPPAMRAKDLAWIDERQRAAGVRSMTTV